MIRVHKSDTAPKSLEGAGYRGQDVQRRFLDDQHDKCYLGERRLLTDYEVEHLCSQKHFPSCKQEWSNLLLACKYCNDRKGARHDGILHPVEIDIELLIRHGIDRKNKNTCGTFSAEKEDIPQIADTIKLLSMIFDGKKVKGERHYQYFATVMAEFRTALNNYSLAPSDSTRLVVEQLLSIEQEFLGFKYWMLREDEVLCREFSHCCRWNRVEWE